jgi:hypothetical protein
MNKLAEIQSKIKAPKGQFNKFGNYKYRSAEDIVEAVKPVINPLGFSLTLTDELVNIGTRYYIKSTATLTNGTETFYASAFAREDETIKGMAGAQITGAASSYARKYALNGLFAIDDTKDADSTNTHEVNDVPTKEEREMLINLLYNSDLSDVEADKAMELINTCQDYKTYEKIQHKLEARQLPIDQIPNPSQKDIKNHVKKIAGV